MLSRHGLIDCVTGLQPSGPDVGLWGNGEIFGDAVGGGESAMFFGLSLLR